MSLRSGELFAGVGGLGMAVDEVFGSEPAWFAEFDAAPSKVLAHRYPDVPNFGDVTQLRDAPKVDILAGGFPCQDVSLAGARRGMKDGTRSGLWSEYARIIDEVRPDWVVIENVRGLISARADSEVEPCTWCVGDGDDEYHLRALDAVLADLSRLGFDAEWTGLRAADIGAPHGRFRFFILAWPAAYTRGGESKRWGIDGFLAGASRAGEGVSEERERDGDAAGDSGGSSALSLLPTPTAGTQSKSSRAMSISRDNGRRTGGGQSSPLGLEETASLLAGIRPEHLPPDGELPPASLSVVRALLPTPGAYDGERGGSQHPDKRRDGGHSVTLQDVSEHLLPTPTVGNATGGNAQRGGDRGGERLLPGLAQDHATDWGPYSAAIARWESATGRPAPSPVRNDGKGGKLRLNPELPEWMMGWPAGWVTDPKVGLTRAEQLKAAGNGVVPQQAAAALRMLLSRPGVPAVTKEKSYAS